MAYSAFCSASPSAGASALSPVTSGSLGRLGRVGSRGFIGAFGRLGLRGRSFLARAGLDSGFDGFLGDRLGRSLFASAFLGNGFGCDALVGGNFLGRQVGGVGRGLLGGDLLRDFFSGSSGGRGLRLFGLRQLGGALLGALLGLLARNGLVRVVARGALLDAGGIEETGDAV